jgi:hypothetical protein
MDASPETTIAGVAVEAHVKALPQVTGVDD